MPPYKAQRTVTARASGNKEAVKTSPCMSFKMRLLSILVMVLGPLFLIYLNLRCEKNQCVLLQLPLVIPTHPSAYFSPLSAIVVLGYITLIFTFSISSRPFKSAQPTLSSGFTSLVSTTWLLLALAYLRPEYIKVVYGEYLRILSTTTVFCIVFSAIVFVLSRYEFINKDKEYCFLMGFFYGHVNKLYVGHVDLKYFFYVHVGLVAWALLDLLILINSALSSTLTASLLFLVVTQYLFIAHTLKFEQFMHTRPFNYSEGLGFFWMMRVLLYLPFFHSLPVLYSATTSVVLPKPAMLANCILFLFGFVIYISSIHQKENFLASPGSYKNLQSIPSGQGKRLLISGYWGVVQKPDYLGYLIIWLSWVFACGFSGLAVVVMLIIYSTVFVWLNQSTHFNKMRFSAAWSRYNELVPKKIIPLVF